MRYLVDTNVLNESTKPLPNPRVVAWLHRNEPTLSISSIVLGELHLGALLLAPGRKRNHLLKWFYDVQDSFPSFDFDTATAEVWADLMARLQKQGRTLPFKDSIIASTAIRHNLVVATRHVVDFQHTGVKFVNPFES